MARLSTLVTVGALAAQVMGACVRRFDSTEPFYEHDAKTPADCSLWWNSHDSLSCDNALLIAGVSVEDLAWLNPSTKSCGDWKTHWSYCIKAASCTPPVETTPAPVPSPTTTKTASTTATTKPPTTTTTTTTNPPTTTASPTQPSDGVQTPQPVQPGMVGNCNRFFEVKSGDTCSAIATKQGVTVAQLAQWNTGIGGTACTGMWAGTYLCTGVSGGSSPTQPAPSNTTQSAPSNPTQSAPSNPTQSAPSSTIQLAPSSTTQSAPSNPTQSAPSSTTQPASSSPTPQPVQDGMVKDCKKFHFVKSGENCSVISSQYGVALADFLKWNPAAGNNCLALWANTYACVGL